MAAIANERLKAEKETNAGKKKTCIIDRYICSFGKSPQLWEIAVGQTPHIVRQFLQQEKEKEKTMIIEMMGEEKPMIKTHQTWIINVVVSSMTDKNFLPVSPWNSLCFDIHFHYRDMFVRVLRCLGSKYDSIITNIKNSQPEYLIGKLRMTHFLRQPVCFCCLSIFIPVAITINSFFLFPSQRDNEERNKSNWKRSVTISVDDGVMVIGGYRGFYARNTIPLTPKVVNDIHKRGGTILGTSRGGYETSKIVDIIQDRGINQVYIIGGDGTKKGASVIYEEIRRRGLRVSVIRIPKIIDNDILVIDKSFGFDSAVEEAQRAINASHVESESSENCIGLVKLMGMF
ncbi:hypothetical protein ACFE04_029285 [Oxalis oulophora]